MKYIYMIFRLYRAPKCKHFWLTEQKEEMINPNQRLDGKGGIIGKLVVLKCKRCGDLKNHYIKASV